MAEQKKACGFSFEGGGHDVDCPGAAPVGSACLCPDPAKWHYSWCEKHPQNMPKPPKPCGCHGMGHNSTCYQGAVEFAAKAVPDPTKPWFASFVWDSQTNQTYITSPVGPVPPDSTGLTTTDAAGFTYRWKLLSGAWEVVKTYKPCGCVGAGAGHNWSCPEAQTLLSGGTPTVPVESIVPGHAFEPSPLKFVVDPPEQTPEHPWGWVLGGHDYIVEDTVSTPWKSAPPEQLMEDIKAWTEAYETGTMPKMIYETEHLSLPEEPEDDVECPCLIPHMVSCPLFEKTPISASEHDAPLYELVDDEDEDYSGDEEYPEVGGAGVPYKVAQYNSPVVLTVCDCDGPPHTPNCALLVGKGKTAQGLAWWVVKAYSGEQGWNDLPLLYAEELKYLHEEGDFSKGGQFADLSPLEIAEKLLAMNLPTSEWGTHHSGGLVPVQEDVLTAAEFNSGGLVSGNYQVQYGGELFWKGMPSPIAPKSYDHHQFEYKATTEKLFLAQLAGTSGQYLIHQPKQHGKTALSAKMAEILYEVEESKLPSGGEIPGSQSADDTVPVTLSGGEVYVDGKHMGGFTGAKITGLNGAMAKVAEAFGSLDLTSASQNLAKLAAGIAPKEPTKTDKVAKAFSALGLEPDPEDVIELSAPVAGPMFTAPVPPPSGNKSLTLGPSLPSGTEVVVPVYVTGDDSNNLLPKYLSPNEKISMSGWAEWTMGEEFTSTYWTNDGDFTNAGPAVIELHWAATLLPSDTVSLTPGVPEDGHYNVATPEGVKKYGQPIGSIIKKDKITGKWVKIGEVGDAEKKDAPAAASKVAPVESTASVSISIQGVEKLVAKPGTVVYHQHKTTPETAPAKFFDVPGVGLMFVNANGHSKVEKPALVAAMKKQIAEGTWVPEKPKPVVVEVKDKDGSWKSTTTKPPVQQTPKKAPDAPAATTAPLPQGVDLPTTNIGGVDVTVDQVVNAIDLLVNQKGIYVTQPLQAGGNPLAKMDFHPLAKQEKKAGFKGNTKSAVIEHLTKKAKAMGASEAAQQAIANWKVQVALPKGQGKAYAVVDEPSPAAKALAAGKTEVPASQSPAVKQAPDWESKKKAFQLEHQKLQADKAANDQAKADAADKLFQKQMAEAQDKMAAEVKAKAAAAEAASKLTEEKAAETFPPGEWTKTIGDKTVKVLVASDGAVKYFGASGTSSGTELNAAQAKALWQAGIWTKTDPFAPKSVDPKSLATTSKKDPDASFLDNLMGAVATQNKAAAKPDTAGNVQIGNLSLKPGTYKKKAGKAYIAVHKDGTADYVKSNGETFELTPKTLAWQMAADGGGLSWYAGPEVQVPGKPEKTVGAPAPVVPVQTPTVAASPQAGVVPDKEITPPKVATTLTPVPSGTYTVTADPFSDDQNAVNTLVVAKDGSAKEFDKSGALVSSPNAETVAMWFKGGIIKKVDPSAEDAPLPAGKYTQKHASGIDYVITVFPDGTASKMWPSGAVSAFPAGMINAAHLTPIPEKVTQAPTAQEKVDAPVKAAQAIPAGEYGLIDDQGKFTSLTVYSDGSASVHSKGSTDFLSSFEVSELAGKGGLTDQYGTTYFTPGKEQPAKIHVFGSSEPLNLAAMKYWLQLSNEAPDNEQFWTNWDSFVKNDDSFTLVKKWAVDNNATMAKIVPALTGKLDSLVHSMEPEVQKTVATSVTTPGVVEFDASTGYAEPFSGSIGQVTNGSEAKALIKAISGQYGDGKVVGKGIGTMSTNEMYDWLKKWGTGDLKGVYALEAANVKKPHVDHPGAPGNEHTHQVQWGPVVAGEVPAGVSVLPEVDASWKWPESWVNTYLVKANMQNPEQLTEKQRERWAKLHQQGQKFAADKLSLLAAQRAALGKPTLTGTPVLGSLEPPKAYTAYVEGSFPTASWSMTALNAFNEEHDLTGSSNFASIANAVDKFLHKGGAIPQVSAPPVNDELTFTDLTTESLLSIGTNSGVKLVKDQFGGQWVWKPAKNVEKWRADVEHGALTLSRLWGFNAPDSQLVTIDGVAGQVQRRVAAEKSLTGVDLRTLTPKQLGQLVSEHMLDWGFGNDDSHKENFLVSPDADIVGIDKGRAYRNFGIWKGLTSGQEMNSNTNVVYSELYSLIRNDKFSEETVAGMYKAARSTAAKMSTLSDAKMREVLEAAFADRPFGPHIAGPGSKEALIQAALDRKNGLKKDVEKLWDEIYDVLSYDKPQGPNPLINPQGHTVHTSFGPDLLADVAKTKNYGTTAFVSGTEVEDGTVLVWREKLPDGTFRLRAELKLRSTALTTVENYLESRVTEGPASALPQEQGWYTALVDGAKTISHHAQDKNYNTLKLHGMQQAKTELEAALPGFEKEGDGSAVEMVKKYLGYIDAIEAHKEAGTKSTSGEFPRHTYVPPVKEPSQPSALEPKVVKTKATTWKSGQWEAGLDADGELVLDGNGPTSTSNSGQMYDVTFPSGEKMEYRGSVHTGTLLAQRGLLRFTVQDEKDGAVAMERLRTQLSAMGVDLKEPDETDMELLYWRSLANVMRTRSDSYPGADLPYGADTQQKEDHAKYQKMWEKHDSALENKGGAEEVAMWRAAFAEITTPSQVESFVAGGGHLPRFSHFDSRNPQQPSGKPYWERFDAKDSDWIDQDFPMASSSFAKYSSQIVNTGGSFSTEARLRTLGLDVGDTSLSSMDDMAYGSSGFVFTRLNKLESILSGDSGVSVMFNPRILKRTSAYSYNQDLFGKLEQRKYQAPFSLSRLSNMTVDNNETMIKDGLSLMDDIELLMFNSAQDRLDAIERLAKLDITEIRGVSVADRFVVWKGQYDASSREAVEKAVKRAKEALKNAK